MVPGLHRVRSGMLLLVALAIAPAGLRAQAAGAAAAAPRTFSLAEFRSLQWLEGLWRGRLPNGGWFYERRAFTNDSTLTTTNYADSTLTRVTETGDVTLRGGVIASDGGRRLATSLDASHVEFVRGTGKVRFDRRPERRWVATLSYVDREGRPQQVVYNMEPWQP